MAAYIKNVNVNMLSPSNFTSRNLPEMFIHIQRRMSKNVFAKSFVFVRTWEYDKGPLIKDCFKVVVLSRRPCCPQGELLGYDTWGGCCWHPAGGDQDAAECANGQPTASVNRPPHMSIVPRLRTPGSDS